jgi:hypothetical protein
VPWCTPEAYIDARAEAASSSIELYSQLRIGDGQRGRRHSALESGQFRGDLARRFDEIGHVLSRILIEGGPAAVEQNRSLPPHRVEQSLGITRGKSGQGRA